MKTKTLDRRPDSPNGVVRGPGLPAGKAGWKPREDGENFVIFASATLSQQIAKGASPAFDLELELLQKPVKNI